MKTKEVKKETIFGLTTISKKLEKVQLKKFDTSIIKELSSNEKKILSLISYLNGIRKADKEKGIFFSQKKFSYLSQLSVSTVKRITSSLEKKGYITKFILNNNRTFYKVNYDSSIESNIKQEPIEEEKEEIISEITNNININNTNKMENTVNTSASIAALEAEIQSLKEQVINLSNELETVKEERDDYKDRVLQSRAYCKDINWLKERVKKLEEKETNSKYDNTISTSDDSRQVIIKTLLKENAKWDEFTKQGIRYGDLTREQQEQLAENTLRVILPKQQVSISTVLNTKKEDEHEETIDEFTSRVFDNDITTNNNEELNAASTSNDTSNINRNGTIGNDIIRRNEVSNDTNAKALQPTVIYKPSCDQYYDKEAETKKALDILFGI